MDEEEHAEETEEIEAIEVAGDETADKVKPEYDGGFRKPRLVSVLDTLGFDPDFFDPRTKYTIEDLTGKCVMVEALNATNSNTNFLLNMLTDAMLRTQADFVENERRVGIRAGRLPGILLESHIRDRWRREIQCVDQETTCLSKTQGWITYDQISTNETILVFNPDTQQTHWEEIRDLFVMDDYAGEAYRINASGIDALVTPGHKWPVGWKHKNKTISVSETITEELNSSTPCHFLYLAAPHGDFPAEPTYSDEFVRLLAWIFTEGHIWGRKSAPRICIVQSEVKNAPFVEMIRSDLEAVGADFTYFAPGANIGPGGMKRREGLYCREYDHKGGLGSGSKQFILSGTEVDKFVEVAGWDKRTSMEFLCSLTEDQIHMFVDVLMYAEGGKGTAIFAQHRKPYMDMAVVAFVVAGFNARLHTNVTRCTVTGWQNRKGGRKWFTRPLRIDEEYYEGAIWCPVTYAGHWVARRNGKTYITGNTTTGTPDPAYTRDPRFPGQIPLYNRVSEHGRKVSTPSQRRDSGSSFFL